MFVIINGSKTIIIYNDFWQLYNPVCYNERINDKQIA